MAFIFLFIGLFCLVCLLLMRFALPAFGKKATVLIACLGAFILVARAPRLLTSPLREQILTPTYFRFVLLPATALLIALLFTLGSAPLWVALGRWAKRRTKNQSAPATTQNLLTPTDSSSQSGSYPSRRQVLTTLSWSIPSLALATASYGTLVESQSLAVRRLRLIFPHLPPSLEGLRIGQITDAHISHDFTLMSSLEAACEKLAQERLDLLLTTGDLCDHLPQFGEVVNVLSQVKTRLGHYACLGNHEIYLGLDQVRKAHEHSSLHLLENTEVQLGELHLAGISYPSQPKPRMEIDPQVATRFLTQALSQKEEGSFTLLLSHHPHVINQAKEQNVDAVLSGHLHGGQIGLGERSLLEPIYGYTRGLYEVQNSTHPLKKTQLFVSNGLGHWLPFRIACPPEVVVIELSSGNSTNEKEKEKEHESHPV